ncbi:MAG: GTP 3',8-cyclase MoaA [Deltaproteobacteria bacterium]|nr:GTP 3',8-cyclase MoaA [Deltaproteobacteria bacterium]
MATNVDPFNRRITYLRVSVTDRCNLRCRYCVPVKHFTFLDHGEILNYEEILQIVRAAACLGINKVRLTGGEPLIRRNLVHLIKQLCAVDALTDVTLTTNGVFLKDMARAIFDGGIHRINVSLDTLDPEKFSQITGRDCFNRVWRGLQEARDVGFSPIRINVVAIRGFNEDELEALARLSIDGPYQVRFIEYMPIGKDTFWTPERFISVDDIKSALAPLGPLERIPSSAMDGPAERYRFSGGRGELGFISAMSHQFCHACNRLRLTADGKLRPCLFADYEVDLKTPLRTGCGQDDLVALFHRAIDKKPGKHHAARRGRMQSARPMTSIGG